MLQYEPNGLEPRYHDIVNYEGYGLYPHTVLPPGDTLPLIVNAISGNYVLCTYRTSHGWMAKVRIHRYKLFVVERQTYTDRVYNGAMRPLDYVFSTRIGRFVSDL